MHRIEAEQLAACSVCGAEVTLQDRPYTYGEDQVLCFECATARNGSYDEAGDRWEVPPNIADLLEIGAEASR